MRPMSCRSGRTEFSWSSAAPVQGREPLGVERVDQLPHVVLAGGEHDRDIARGPDLYRGHHDPGAEQRDPLPRGSGDFRQALGSFGFQFVQEYLGLTSYCIPPAWQPCHEGSADQAMASASPTFSVGAPAFRNGH